jgi:hypothetical protein
MKNKTLIALFTALLAVALVAGCSNFTGPDTLGAPAGKGTLTLSVKGVGGGRTIMPLVSYEATITGGAATIVTPLLAGPNVLALAAGTYDIAVTASIDGVVIAAGSATGVTVAADAAGNATIELALNDELTGKGTFKWDLSDFAGDKKITVYEMNVVSVDGPGYVKVGTQGTSFGGSNSFADIVAIPIPASTDLTGYTTLIFDMDTFANGDKVVATGQYNNNISYKIFDVATGGSQLGSQEYNGGGGTAPYMTWTIPAAAQKAFTDPGRVVVSAANKSNPVDVLQIKSIKFTGAGKPDIELISSASDGYVAGPPIYSTTIETTPVVPAATTAAGSLELDFGVYYVEFEIGDVKWSEVLWIAGSGVVSEYLPSFEDVFTGTVSEKLEDLVLAAIEAGSIDFTIPELSALGIAGVAAGNLSEVKTSITAILAVNPDTNEPPADLAGLKVLVDAALISAGASKTNPLDPPAAETAMKALIKNATDPTTVSVDWDNWGTDYSVTITVSPYVFTVSIIPEPEFLEQVNLAQNVPVYEFNLPVGAKYSDYTAIKVNYLIDADNLAKNIRLHRLYGAFNNIATRFTDVDGVNFLNFGDNSDINDFIYDDKGGAWSPIVGPTADEWYTFTYLLEGNNPNNANAQKYPDADATGPFYFGFGIPGTGDTGGITYKMKLITMVHKSDPTQNVGITPDDFYGYAGYAGADAFDVCTRTLVYNPDYMGTITPFDLDLTNVVDGTVGGAFVSPAPVGTDNGDGSVTFAFLASSGNTEAAGIALSENDNARLMASSTINVYVEWLSSDDNATFRACFGNIMRGGAWNHTGWVLSGDNKLSTINATTVSGIGVTTKTGFDDNPAGSIANLPLQHFILQKRNGTVADVTITKITITCIR